MGVSTHGLIKGYVRHEEIYNFIKQRYDNNAEDHVRKSAERPIKEVTWNHKMNEHSENDNIWYSINGYIYFKYNGEDRALFFNYDNVNHLENLDYYSEYGLQDMVESETTYLSLSCYGNSVDIMKEIVAHFGGWLDENDCDEVPYYPIDVRINDSIKPVIFVTMKDICEKFGGTVVITQ